MSLPGLFLRQAPHLPLSRRIPSGVGILTEIYRLASNLRTVDAKRPLTCYGF